MDRTTTHDVQPTDGPNKTAYRPKLSTAVKSDQLTAIKKGHTARTHPRTNRPLPSYPALEPCWAEPSRPSQSHHRRRRCRLGSSHYTPLVPPETGPFLSRYQPSRFSRPDRANVAPRGLVGSCCRPLKNRKLVSRKNSTREFRPGLVVWPIQRKHLWIYNPSLSGSCQRCAHGETSHRTDSDLDHRRLKNCHKGMLQYARAGYIPYRPQPARMGARAVIHIQIPNGKYGIDRAGHIYRGCICPGRSR